MNTLQFFRWGKYEFEIGKFTSNPVNDFRWEHSKHYVYTWNSLTTEWLIDHSFWQYQSIDGALLKLRNSETLKESVII